MLRRHLLHALGDLGRAGLVIVELVALDAHAHDLARVDVHPVCCRGVEELVHGRRLGVWQPEVSALVRVAVLRAEGERGGG